MKQCQILLEEPDIETAVRIGDVYGIMIEHLAREQNYSKVSNWNVSIPHFPYDVLQVKRIKPRCNCYLNYIASQDLI